MRSAEARDSSAEAATRLSSSPSMFGPLDPFGGLGRGSFHRLASKEEVEIERKMEMRRGPCLLDCIEMDLTEVDVFSAKRKQGAGGKDSFKIERQVSDVIYIFLSVDMYLRVMYCTCMCTYVYMSV